MPFDLLLEFSECGKLNEVGTAGSIPGRGKEAERCGAAWQEGVEM